MSKRILIVEDEKALNDAYRMVLEQSGYITAVAFDGKEALKIVDDFNPDLILLDLRMPVMDGVEFLRNYDMTKHDDVKVIVFSNYDMQKEIDQAYELGAEKYLLKAWASPKELLHVIKNTLQ